jgi:hypothetical protein
LILEKKALFKETQAMQHTIQLDMAACLAEDGFSLDEVVIKTRELFETEGMAGMIGLLLRLADELICRRRVGSSPADRRDSRTQKHGSPLGMERDCDGFPTSSQPLDQMLADGTAFKRRFLSGTKQTNRGGDGDGSKGAGAVRGRCGKVHRDDDRPDEGPLVYLH